LRWGITDEQVAEGKVLPLCLAEIEHSRPYFIGLLGERYGWIPDSIPPEVIAREPWLREHLEQRTSVTELEFLHGVLNDPAMAGHAFFYFRNPAYGNGAVLGEAERQELAERNIPADIDKYGEAEATRRTDERKAKLDALKERIRDSKLPLVEPYADPETLGQIIQQQFDDLIDRLYPEIKVPDALDREAMEHDAFAQSRAGVYIGRQEYFDRLDAHAAGRDEQGLVILGESGSGKSALLANWAMRHRAAHPDELKKHTG